MIELSQTLIKHLLDGRQCPHKAMAMYIKKTHRNESSVAQMRGQYFEYLTLGNPDYYGKMIKDLPRNADYSKTTDQVNIEKLARRFKEEVIPLYDIHIIGKNYELSHQWTDDIKLTTRLDFIGTMKYNDEDIHFLGDLKLTANMKSTYGDYAWGMPHLMDHTQALFYYLVFSREYKSLDEPMPDPKFIYFIFDYKHQDFTLLHVKPDSIRMMEIRESIRLAAEKIEQYTLTGYPYLPTYDNCKSCPLNGTCPRAQRFPEIKTV